MAKNDFGQRKNPLKMVIYIAAVIILLVCILIMVFRTRSKQRDYESEIAQLSQGETEYVRPERTTEAETETGSEASDDSAAASEETQEQDASDEAEQEESQEDSQETESSEEDGAEESETESESEEIQADLRILVLNGTGIEGVAGYWESQLEADGYEDVISASYAEQAEDETVIYTQERQLALPFQDYFTESRIRIGEITEGILMSDGEEEPEDVDIYIVVGNTDARSE